MDKFKLDYKYKPKGDQPKAIKQLVEGIKHKNQFQTLLGVTGSGKTFTVANVIAQINKPTLVIAHNKTLAAQLTSEFRTFFPGNAVEYFVSYYDYYQPEAYLPTTDTYIEKETEINEEIDRLRHAATQAVLSRKDVIVVATVSCIYGLGSPSSYKETSLTLSKGENRRRQEIIDHLIDMYFARGTSLYRGKFRAHGETIEIMPADEEKIIRIELSGDKIKKITILHPIKMTAIETPKQVTIYPAKHFVVGQDLMDAALSKIEHELKERIKYFEREGKILEAERICRRTRYDIEMMREIGYCAGIENYSRYLTGRKSGEAPYTLLDYFDKDFLLVVDESHVTIPQLQGMFEGDKSRKDSLIEHGFRLPSAYDNRPLKSKEFLKKINQTIFTSATPAKFERQHSGQIVQQIIRPTGLVDPEVVIKPISGQIEDLIHQVKEVSKRNERVLVTTLTKRMTEDLSEHLRGEGLRARYLHSEVDTLDRINILKELRAGKFDILVGVNLLREGLDLPEVSLVAILDADKEGFLRSETSLIQTIGRAARNVRGKVILYADNITGSMKRAIDETRRRRDLQTEHNKKHHITPKTIQKSIKTIIDHEITPQYEPEFIKIESLEDIPGVIKIREKEMKSAAKNLDFEKAAVIRDEILTLKKLRFKS